ncbi:MAG: hypothetical protein SPL61_11485 [Saccharofermentans sp.]|nr:hypothetical protein [Saccharofermentans sp.]
MMIETSTIILICVGLVFFIGFGIWTVILFSKDNEGGFATGFAAIVGCVLFIVGYWDYNDQIQQFNAQQRTQQQQLQIEAAESRWDAAVDESYSFYIDGSEVEPENINKDFYQIQYDDAGKKVFMTKRG